MTKTMSVAGTTLELIERGHGRPLLFLHVKGSLRSGCGSVPESVDLRVRKIYELIYQAKNPVVMGLGLSPHA
jgi:hypothetical protein